MRSFKRTAAHSTENNDIDYENGSAIFCAT
jgi:hypothetical protein